MKSRPNRPYKMQILCFPHLRLLLGLVIMKILEKKNKQKKQTEVTPEPPGTMSSDFDQKFSAFRASCAHEIVGISKGDRVYNQKCQK